MKLLSQASNCDVISYKKIINPYSTSITYSLSNLIHVLFVYLLLKLYINVKLTLISSVDNITKLNI